MEEEDANLFRKPHFYHQNHNAKFQPNPRNKSSGTWKNLNFGNGNLGVENSGVFIPSPAVNSAMSFPDSDFGSRSRIYNDETESWSESPNLQNGNSNHFIPSAASSASMPACVGDFASAIQESMSAKFNHAWSYVKKQDEMRSEENNNVALGGENANNFMPSAAFSPSMLTSADGFASSAQILKSAKINHGRSSPKKKEAMRSKNNNVALSGENTNSFMPAAAFSPSIPTSADSFASSAQTSKSAKINHGRSSQKKKEEMRSKNNVALSGENTNSFVPSAEFSPSVPTSPDGFDSSGQSIKSAKINHGRTSPKKKEEMRSTNNKVALSGENTSNCMPSVPASADDFVSPIQESKCAKFTHGSSFKKKDEMRSEENKCVVLDEDYANNFMPSAASLPSMPPSANYLSSSVQESKSAKFSHGSSLKKKDEMRSESSNVALGGENANIVMPSAVFSPSLPISAEEFAPSVKVSKSAKFNHGKNKEEMRSESNNVAVVGSFQEEINSYTLNFDGPLSGGKSKLENGNSGGEILDFFKNTVEVLSSVTAPVNEFASLVKSSKDGKCCNGVIVKKDEERLEKMNEQTSIPERWDSDCFVIPSSENNDMRELLQDNPSPSLIDSSEAPSSAGSSTRMSCHEEGSPRNRVEEIDISEIKDVLGENDSYKPSTPSPPPQVQTRRNDDVASSVESSSRALEIRSLLNDDDAHGSPPTPGRRKALSRASHSRRFSCGFFDRDLRKSFKEEAKEANKKTKGDHHQFPRGGKCGAWDCLKLDVKPTLNKAVLKGKSVRTIKPKDTHQEQKCEENNEMVLIKIGISEKRANSDGRKGEKLQEISGTSIIVGLNSKQNSNGATAVLVDEVKEEENDSEIDRKADEFIAKFKQQIRLQKVAPRGDSSRQHRNSAN
ncbi:uncharacterized protein LOC125495539 [Beta vulgaris subsp. vulgaris]|uniref:uncharacterized protein LOC125495539 n=1 Tax=Beta vulgaris subsp. vulgaris TaxID=3555 RepID=UPI0020369A6D|nr:uncharacterized protein LOC125495539 [Beta vulgaris subsp. vulgaris]